MSDSRSETGAILVVDDESVLLEVIKRVLEERGYTVLCASSSREAEAVFSQRHGKISLLIADVALPETTGPALFDQLVASHPSLKVLYTSGYPRDVLGSGGVRGPVRPFLQKPFRLDAVVQKVNEVLHA